MPTILDEQVRRVQKALAARRAEAARAAVPLPQREMNTIQETAQRLMHIRRLKQRGEYHE